MEAYQKTIDQIKSELAIDPAIGLTADEVKKRLAHYGPNRLQEKKPPSAFMVQR